MINIFIKTKEKLAEKSGFSELMVVFFVFIVTIICIVVTGSFMSIYAKHNLVNATAHELARYIEVNGIVNGDTADEFDRLTKAVGIENARYTVSKSGKIALEEPFTVRVEMPGLIGVGSIRFIPVTVVAAASGRGEVYWK
jgi:hypothetical protein